jgi:hypothetical protein
MFAAGLRSVDESCKAWNSRFAGKEAFIKITNGYRGGSIFSRQLVAHRVIWLLKFGEWPSADIDHINGNRLDNRIENLRAVSRADNLRNRRMPITNTSGIVGVGWDKARGKWRAQIEANGLAKCLGHFEEKADAAAARKAAEIECGFHENHGRDMSRVDI